MKNKMILVVSFLTLSLSFAPAAIACEKHDHAAAKAEPAPARSTTSLYNLTSEWKNQQGQTVTLGASADQPVLLAMVYTQCQTACPLLVQDIKRILAKMDPEKRKSVRVRLFSFDSENETPERLQAFMKKYDLDPERWSVQSADKSSVAELAAVLGVQYKRLPSGEYIHANSIFFLNKKGEIAAQQNGFNTIDVPASFWQ